MGHRIIDLERCTGWCNLVQFLVMLKIICFHFIYTYAWVFDFNIITLHQDTCISMTNHWSSVIEKIHKYFPDVFPCKKLILIVA